MSFLLLVLGLSAAAAEPWLRPGHAGSPVTALDPDLPAFSYRNVGGRWEGRLGGSLAGPDWAVGSWRLRPAIETFVELVNFSDDMPVSFETYRAFVGLDLLIQAPETMVFRPFFRVAAVHESDHVADQERFAGRFGKIEECDPLTYLCQPTVGPGVPWNDLSSYEFIRLRAGFTRERSRWDLHVSGDGRAYTPNLDPYAPYLRRWGVAGETRLRWAIRSDAHEVDGAGGPHLVAGVRVEHIAAGPIPDHWGLRDERDQPDLRLFQAEVGADLDSPGGARLEPHLLIRKGGGRGAEFMAEYGWEWGGGVRFLF